jgi:hypothetical protein
MFLDRKTRDLMRMVPMGSAIKVYDMININTAFNV